jgi:deazaflavin-dependent oxidoreductase (nitroreductase family)
MTTIALLAGTITTALVLVAVVFMTGMRRKTPFVLKAVRRSGRAMKPLVLRSAGANGSPTSVVEHVGRSSGRHYETPVVATRTPGGFAIALPYARTSDWMKNVLAAGGATIRFDGDRYDVVDPEIVRIEVVDEAFAVKEQRLHRKFRITEAVVVTDAITQPLRSACA